MVSDISNPSLSMISHPRLTATTYRLLPERSHPELARLRLSPKLPGVSCGEATIHPTSIGDSLADHGSASLPQSPSYQERAIAMRQKQTETTVGVNDSNPVAVCITDAPNNLQSLKQLKKKQSVHNLRAAGIDQFDVFGRDEARDASQGQFQTIDFSKTPPAANLRPVESISSFHNVPEIHEPSPQISGPKSRSASRENLNVIHPTLQKLEKRSGEASATKALVKCQIQNGGEYRTVDGLGEVDSMAGKSTQVRKAIEAIKFSQQSSTEAQGTGHTDSRGLSKYLEVPLQVRQCRSRSRSPPRSRSRTKSDHDTDMRNQRQASGVSMQTSSNDSFREFAESFEGSSVSPIKAEAGASNYSSTHKYQDPSQSFQTSRHTESPKVYGKGKYGLRAIDVEGRSVDVLEMPAREEVKMLCFATGAQFDPEQAVDLNNEIIKVTNSLNLERQLKEQALLQYQQASLQIQAMEAERTIEQQNGVKLPANPKEKRKTIELLYQSLRENFTHLVDENHELQRELKQEKKANAETLESLSQVAHEYKVQMLVLQSKLDQAKMYDSHEGRAELKKNLQLAVEKYTTARDALEEAQRQNKVMYRDILAYQRSEVDKRQEMKDLQQQVNSLVENLENTIRKTQRLEAENQSMHQALQNVENSNRKSVSRRLGGMLRNQGSIKNIRGSDLNG